MTIKLEWYKETFKQEIETYNLPQDQQRFTAMPKEALKTCEKEPDRHPVVILSDGDLAGFFVLHEGEDIRHIDGSGNAILLRAYSIDSRFQGKGIAGRSLVLLPSFVKKHFPNKEEIVLAVNHANPVAQHVYTQAGFEDRGKRIIGRMGEQYILHLSL
ncbi:GCN5 family acetyltransferase [Bacillus sp. FJAT-27225]|uniref:GNAT family N-acetyltransferase n=1 Tax=Bacillus sp. FJAT-27225 TaxID=1743144 RepID=UPI00080C21CA|nr:GNAT family N-acetyltransferase [Bacillus sp. FJAT-27225]OCA82424.1 GCN5 family acetyltransferase [Bacillus sp. FJAT-27225]